MNCPLGTLTLLALIATQLIDSGKPQAGFPQLDEEQQGSLPGWNSLGPTAKPPHLRDAVTAPGSCTLGVCPFTSFINTKTPRMKNHLWSFTCTDCQKQ